MAKTPAPQLGLSEAIREDLQANGVNSPSKDVKSRIIAKHPYLEEKVNSNTFSSTLSTVGGKLGRQGRGKSNDGPTLWGPADSDEPSADELLNVMAATKNPQQQKALQALATVQALASELTGGNILKLISALNKLKEKNLL